MIKILFRTPIDQPLEKVKEAFNENLFKSLTPSYMPLELLRFDGCKEGDEVHIEMGPLKQKWVSLITSVTTTSDSWEFVDEGKVLPWPLTGWKHIHRLEKTGPDSCVIIDDINYESFPNVLALAIKPIMWQVFSVRPKLYTNYFKDQK